MSSRRKLSAENMLSQNQFSLQYNKEMCYSIFYFYKDFMWIKVLKYGIKMRTK